MADTEKGIREIAEEGFVMNELQNKFYDLMMGMFHSYILYKQGKNHLPLSKELIETFDKLNISEENYKDYALAMAMDFNQEEDKTDD